MMYNLMPYPFKSTGIFRKKERFSGFCPERSLLPHLVIFLCTDYITGKGKNRDFFEEKKAMLDVKSCEALVCVVDVQEKLIPAMGNGGDLLKRLNVLLGGCAALEIPFLVTEQYPKGLGNTLEEIRGIFPEGTAVFEKNSFSCFGSEEFASAVKDSRKKWMILCGVESHVCVFQTALEAKKNGLEVILVEDCVDSRHGSDKTTALKYLRHAGVHIVSSEMVLFLLMKSSANPAFKVISKLVR